MFETPDYPYDGYFYNEIVRMADDPAIASIAEEVRDRALQATARSFRRGLENRRTPPWSRSCWAGQSCGRRPSSADAEFAVTNELKRSVETIVHREPLPGHSLQIGAGQSSRRACQAAVTGELFLGFENGLVCIYRPESEQVVEVATNLGPVTGLAVDPDGQTVVVLYESAPRARHVLLRKAPDGSYRSQPGDRDSAVAGGWLTPILPMGVERLVGFSDGQDAHRLTPRPDWPASDGGSPKTIAHARAAVLLAAGSAEAVRRSRLVTSSPTTSTQWVVPRPIDDRL